MVFYLPARYNLAENIDGQLKTMVQDLREVVEHINSTSTPGNENNPVKFSVNWIF